MSIVVPSLWFCSGVMMAVSMLSVVISAARYRIPLHLTFSICCLSASIFVFGYANYYSASSVAEALVALRIQSFSIIFFLPAFFAFIAVYTEQKKIKAWILLVGFYAGAHLLLLLISPEDAERFRSISMEAPLILPWGETLPVFAGEAATGNKVFRLVLLVVLCWAIWRSVIQYRGGQRRMAMFLMACLALIFATSTWGWLVDNKIIRSFYTGGYSFLSFSALMVVSLGLELRDQVIRREEILNQLENKNAELERFAYTVSHDLKNPLFTLKGYLGYLESDLEAGDKEVIEKDLKHMIEASNNMEALLNDVLELSRIGLVANDPALFPLTDLVEENRLVLRAQIEESGALVDVSPDMPLVYADRSRIAEVMQNLIENAIKFSGQKTTPRVTVKAEVQADRVICRVEDNGKGIDPRYHDKIFDLFDRLETDVPGTGIGLALAKRIIEASGGEIWVESEGAGMGATFCFTLPCSASL